MATTGIANHIAPLLPRPWHPLMTTHSTPHVSPSLSATDAPPTSTSSTPSIQIKPSQTTRPPKSFPPWRSNQSPLITANTCPSSYMFPWKRFARHLSGPPNMLLMSCPATISNRPSSRHSQPITFGVATNPSQPTPSLATPLLLVLAVKPWHSSLSDANRLSLMSSESHLLRSSSTPLKMSSEEGERWTSSSPTALQLKFQTESKKFCALFALTIGSQNHTTNTKTLLNIDGTTSYATSIGT